MKISIIGTGTVGQTLAVKLTELGHDVFMGTRNISEKLASQKKDNYGNPSFNEWYKANTKVHLVTFSDAAKNGEIVINATRGENSIEALKMAGAKDLAGKILIDISNPLDFSKGMPPGLLPGLNNTHSLGEEIQQTFPLSLVVKTLNTMWCGLMVNPKMIDNGNHVNFICGNDTFAKKRVVDLLKQIGWMDENIIDLGDISGARAAESVLHLWLRLMGIFQSSAFNFSIIK